MRNEKRIGAASGCVWATNAMMTRCDSFGDNRRRFKSTRPYLFGVSDDNAVWRAIRWAYDTVASRDRTLRDVDGSRD